MINVRLALAAAVTAVVLVPAASAVAAVDSFTTVHQLADHAASLIAQEQQLLVTVTTESGVSPADLAIAQTQLSVVDLHAQQALEQLDQLGIDLSEAVRAVMEPLPSASSPEAMQRLIPQSIVYQAAIKDLQRIATTPDNATTLDNHGTSGVSFGLLAVAALSLLVLGAAALANTFNKRPSIDEELTTLPWSDVLTGLANRRRLDLDLVDDRHAGSDPVAVVMIGVDHFQQVNDKFGHHVGDQALRRIGVMLSDHVRHGDVVYRYGGAEFCVVLPGASTIDARGIAQRIINAARDLMLPDGSNLTVSIGIADGASEVVASTLQSADRAMSSAKESGCDRAVAADAELSRV
jgi:diguanylate cyclase (GGDEF)-like protein